MSGGLERISAGGIGGAENSHLLRHTDVPGSHDALVHSASEIAGNKVDTLKSELATFLRYFEGMQGPVEIIVEHERSFDMRPGETDSAYERAQEMKSHVQAQLDLAQQAISEYQKALWPDTGGKSVQELTPMRKKAYYDRINSINTGVVVDLQDAINEVGYRLYGNEWKFRWL